MQGQTATFYEGSRGPLADGSRYSAAGHFCAAWQYPLGTIIRLRARNGRSVIVTVRDRGPAYDLPTRTFAALCGPRWREVGRLRVQAEVLGRVARKCKTWNSKKRKAAVR